MVDEGDAAALAADVIMMLAARGRDVRLTPAGEVRLVRLAALMAAEFGAGTKEDNDGRDSM